MNINLRPTITLNFNSALRLLLSHIEFEKWQKTSFFFIRFYKKNHKIK
jgi:hypothetical protein